MVKRERRGGYSLVEVMMAVVILGIIASVSGRVLLQVNRYWILTSTRSDLQREARAAMFVITKELRQAQSNTIVLDRLSASQPFYSRITFTKIQGTSMTFEQNGDQLQQIVGNSTKTLTSHLVYLAFTFPQSDVLSILSVSMTLQQSIYQGQTKALHMSSEEVQVMN
jgi:prepilin-type N-terminal cleavage/methylation domain-containing protein